MKETIICSLIAKIFPLIELFRNFRILEKEMATHSSIVAWEIPWTEEPGGLQSLGSQELDTT